jgi:hypothetical protein
MFLAHADGVIENDKDYCRFKNEAPKESTDSRLANANKARLGDQNGHRSVVKAVGA